MKARFLTPLDVRKVPHDDKHWVHLSDLDFYSAQLARVLRAKKGTTTDFASVPRIPFMYERYGGICQAEGALHDALYRRDGGVTRAQADRVFLEAMKAEGKPADVCYVMYAAVRAFGGRHFHKKGSSA